MLVASREQSISGPDPQSDCSSFALASITVLPFNREDVNMKSSRKCVKVQIAPHSFEYIEIGHHVQNDPHFYVITLHANCGGSKEVMLTCDLADINTTS